MPIVDIMFEKPTFFWVFLQCKVQIHLTVFSSAVVLNATPWDWH